MSEEKNWDDEAPAVEEVGDDGYERGLHERELEDKRQAHEHKEELHEQRKELFAMFKKYVPWMAGVGYFFAFIVIIWPSSQGAVVAGIVLMIPVVISLAMIRLLYGGGGGGSSEKTAPSVVVNIGKELAGVIKAYINKS